MAKLVKIVVPVSDIEQAAKFYFNIFGIKGSRVSAGQHFFNLDDCILECYDPLADGDSLGQGWMHHENQYICFAVKNLDATFIRVKNISDAELESEIHQKEWGERLFYARDPFGNPICFIDEKTVFYG
ncbi:MAG: VOC family protein [Calditrichaeota bacterium]|nr:VOC family protein [Calditrichota bacterium]